MCTTFLTCATPLSDCRCDMKIFLIKQKNKFYPLKNESEPVVNIHPNNSHQPSGKSYYNLDHKKIQLNTDGQIMLSVGEKSCSQVVLTNNQLKLH